MDITITIPRKAWFQWRQALKNRDEEILYFRLGWLPPQDKKIKNCYIIYKSRIIGFFRIKGFINITTGSEEMLKGRYIMLITASWVETKPINAQPHRGFKYLEGIENIEKKHKNLLIRMYEELERRCAGDP